MKRFMQSYRGKADFPRMRSDSVPSLNLAYPAVPTPRRVLSPGAETSDGRWLLWMMAAFAVIYAVFYPLLYTSIDEAATFRMAFVLRHGAVVPHDSGFFPSISPVGIHGRMYLFPIGFPAVLSLVSLAGWKAFFLVNPVLHLVAAWCFGRILQANRVSAKYAVLYLLYPCFVLFTRTLFSDAFAASLTTIGLYFLICRRSTLPAGLCLGVALAARVASAPVAVLMFVDLLADDWRRRGERPLLRGQSLFFLLGLVPFFAVNLLYNNYTMGSPLHSAYSADRLSLHGLLHIGPLYALSLLLIFPGMLAAPFFYRGPFRWSGLAAAVVVSLVAAAYDESTYGNSLLQTLLSTPRQVLPVMPFFLLAYCVVLGQWLPEARLKRVRAFEAAAVLLALAVGISAIHQKYLRRLGAVQTRVAQALPAASIVYANKDAYKLHQPQWDALTYRELPFIADDQAAQDLKSGPVFVVLFVRSRGFAAEDADNQRVSDDLRRFLLTACPISGEDEQISCFRVQGLRPSRRLTHLPEASR